MKHRKGIYPGINIQFPISRLILDKTKCIETRTYPIPEEYIGKKMLIIETPGKEGKFKARIVGFVTFGESFPYKSAAAFYRDSGRHRVTPDSQWKWDSEKPKWGWPITAVTRLSRELPAPAKRGIKFTKEIVIS